MRKAQKHTEDRHPPQLECRKGRMTTTGTRPRITLPTLSGVTCYWGFSEKTGRELSRLEEEEQRYQL